MSLQDISRETLAIIEDGRYPAPEGWSVDISEDLSKAVVRTKVYTPDRYDSVLAAITPRPGHDGLPPYCEVTDERSHVAALRLVREEGCVNVLLLNHGAARNPGGAFANGGASQEADSTRASGLYPCMLARPGYYAANRAAPSYAYTDHIMYTPHVPIFRDGDDALLGKPFTATVVTASAPAANLILASDPDARDALNQTLAQRACYVLAVARRNGHRHIILGAWGCGKKGYEPVVVAEIFGTLIETPRFAGAFERVVFAVHGSDDRSSRSRAAFEARFAGMG